MVFKLTIANLENDIDILFDLDIKSFNRPFDNPANSTQQLKNYLKNCTVYLCYINHKPTASFSYLLKKNNLIELMQMMVLPKYQRKGVGQFMTNKLIEFTKGKRIHTVTHPKNIGAIILYLKNGFIVYGWKENFYGDSQPRLLLKR